VFEQQRGQGVELVQILQQQPACVVKPLAGDRLHGGVDLRCAVFTGLTLAQQRSEVFLVPIGLDQHANALVHAPARHHLAYDGADHLQVVLGAGGDLVEHQLFGHPASQRYGDARQ